MADWLARRVEVLAAAESHANKEAQVEAEVQAAQDAGAAVAAAMSAACIPGQQGTGLAWFCVTADAQTNAASSARIAKAALREQHHALQVALQQAEKVAAAQNSALLDWQQR